MITIKERKTMKHMGYIIKAVYKIEKNGMGIQSRPIYFTNEAAFEDYTKKAANNNIKLISKDKL